jgi:hypothetical protein
MKEDLEMRTTCYRVVAFTLFAGAIAIGYPIAGESAEKGRGVAKGETSQEKGQQGIGLEGSGKSNVIMGGPEIVIGRIASIEGENFAINGDDGQNIRLRVTKDTNMICSGGEGTKMSSGQEAKEQKEIPPSAAMAEQKGSRDQREALNDPNQQQAEHQQGKLSKDPSQLKDVVGSTDDKANKDVARGSGFVVGGGSGCQFKTGDRVRVEASDMGTATTIKQLGG